MKHPILLVGGDMANCSVYAICIRKNNRKTGITAHFRSKNNNNESHKPLVAEISEVQAK